MVRSLAAALALALVLVACSSSINLPVATATPSAAGADSPAADLRTHVDLLFGEHTFVIAKLSVAAAAGRKDEFQSYAGMLAANGGDVTTLMRSALGETAGAQFGQAWATGNNYYVDYMVGAVTHDQAKEEAAALGLTDTYVPQLAQVLTSSLPLSQGEAVTFVGGQSMGAKLTIDHAVAADYPKLYADLGIDYAKEIAFGDALAVAVAARFPDRFPGDLKSKAVDFRASLDSLFQEHAYLTTLASDAFYEGAAAAKDASIGALAASTGSMSHLFSTTFGATAGSQADQLWSREDASFVAYAKARDQTSQLAASDALHNDSAPQLTAFLHAQSGVVVDVNGQILATIQVMDDHDSHGYPQIATDDRAAAGLLVAIGDAVSGGSRA
jgi:hypothetical protein